MVLSELKNMGFPPLCSETFAFFETTVSFSGARNISVHALAATSSEICTRQRFKTWMVNAILVRCEDTPSWTKCREKNYSIYRILSASTSEDIGASMKWFMIMWPMIFKERWGPKFSWQVFRRKPQPRKLIRPRTEPGPAGWKATMLPLRPQRCFSWTNKPHRYCVPV